MFKLILKILTGLLFLSLFPLGISAYYFYKNPISETKINEVINYVYTSEKEDIDFEYDQIVSVPTQPKNVEDIYITGWIPEWDIADGLDSVGKRPNTFDSISPIWFFVNPDGSLKPTTQANGQNQINYYKNNNIELIPTIQDFDADNLTKYLNDPVALDRHIDAIVNNVTTYNYAGIDLDYEAIKLQDKHLFFELLSRLSTKLHEKNKKLVFSVLPKWGDLNFFGAFPQTMRVQDYKRISDYVDELRIMSYELSGPTSQEAGPIAPLEWQEHVIKYTILSGVPREKIVLGLHNYAYDWSDRNVVSRIDLKGRYLPQPVTEQLDLGVGIPVKDITKIKTNYKYTEEFNTEWGEMVMNYDFNGKNRIVIYPNSDSMRLRKELAAEYGIKGIAIWRVGDEGDLQY